MSDILPDQVGQWQYLERTFQSMVKRYGYEEVRTPLLESTALFTRSVGETTDIVDKEMYSFEHNREALTIRPEGTASVVRAYIEHHVHQQQQLTRWWYGGPMFRGERPARGRYRQFHQFGCELFGDPGPIGDAELIDMLHHFFTSLGIGQLDIVVNCIGDPPTRALYRQVVHDYLMPRKNELSEDSQRRLDRNPLRILDSKDPRDIKAVAGMPSVLDYLTDDERTHFHGVCACLDRLQTPYRVDTTLVRGLDYYTRTVFEVRTQAGQVGAQNALGGGGRYDELVRQMGGPSIPAVGFAVGTERILLAMQSPKLPQPVIVTMTPLGSRAAIESLLIARKLRTHGVHVDLDSRGAAGASIKSMLRRANTLGARLSLVIGESELAAGEVQIKDLLKREQYVVPRANVVARVLEALKAEDAQEGPQAGGAG